MSEWVEQPLGELATFVMGQSPESAAVSELPGGLPFLQGCAEFGERTPAPKFYVNPPLRIAPKGSTLISVRAPVGTMNEADQTYGVGRGLAAVVGHQRSNQFLRYAIELNTAWLHRRSQGSTFLAIGSDDLRKLPIKASTDPEECEAAAEVIALLDTQIEATEGLIAKQERVRVGLMQDLFTRGVDEHGQLRPPRHQAPHLYHQTDLGWLPLGWEVSPLLKIVPRAVYGISDSLSDDTSGVPILRMNNIQAGKIDATELKYSSKPLPQGLMLRVGDVLFNRTNSIEHVGKAAIWNGEVDRASFASYLVRLDPDPLQLDAHFLCHWLNRPEVQIEIRRYATPGVHQVNINPTNLRRVNCAHPSNIKEQRAIVNLVGKSEAVISANRDMAAILRHQKAGLMQDLLTGKVTVAPLMKAAPV